MPRKPHLLVSGATYHVYCRLARGELVFDDSDEADEFVEVARSVGDLDGWRILASPLRSPSLIRDRIELTILAVARYRLRSRDIAALIDKHP